jgi:nucleoside-diphosphate-sugar epimerase
MACGGQMIVVTGGLGHIGSKLIQDLSEDVVVIDNLHSQRYCSLMNIRRKGVEFIEADLRMFNESVSKAIVNSSAVIHLAALTDASMSKKNPEPYWNTNLPTLKRVAELCSEYDIPLVFPSTTSVYGQSDNVVDECSELNPQSVYAETKVACEKYLKDTSALRFVIFRFGTICGVSPGMRFHTAVNKFCWQAMTNQPVSIWATALEQKRPYLSLLDAVDAIRYVIDNKIFDREIYNAITMNLTVDKILDTIKEKVSNIRIEYVHDEIMNQLSYEVSARKFEQKGFTFSTNVQDDIMDTLNLFENLKR